MTGPAPAASSPVARGPWGLLGVCGPLSVLGASFLLAAGGIAIDDLAAGALALAVEVVVFVVLVGRTPFPLVRLVPGLLALVSVAWSNWLLGDPRSLSTAGLAAVRVAYFVLPGLVLASCLDPSAVGDHVGQRLRLPGRPVLAIVAALQRLESLAEDWDAVARTHRARGLGPSGPVSRVRHLGALTFALLVQAIRSAGRTTVAMEARGLSAPVSSGVRRSWAHPARWLPADTVLVATAVTLAVLPRLIGLVLH